MHRAKVTLLTLAVATACGGDYWVLNDVTLIDVEAGTSVPNAAVLVHGNRIVAAGQREEVKTPRGAIEIDGNGGFVIPGLWDMHTHLTHAGEDALQLMIANGVTGARDMGGDLSALAAMDTAIVTGRLVGPRMVYTGRWVDGKKVLTDRYILETPEQGIDAVTELAAAGVDHIKVHNGLPRDVFFAVAKETHRRNIRLVGHVPMEVHPAEALDAGLISVEHVATVFEGTVAGSFTTPSDQLRAIRDYAENGADTLASRFVARRAWFTPTLVAYAVQSRLAELDRQPDSRRRYLRQEPQDRWDESFPVHDYELDPTIVAFRKQGDTAFAALVTTFHENGVGLLAGTDLGTREIYPGFSLHDELALLVERSGLSPLEAIRTATINPARYLTATDSLGTVAAGRLADFVVLSANPLNDIRNTSLIRAVVIDGRYLSRAELDQLLENAERGAKEDAKASTAAPGGTRP